jgi:hypothetical protein
VNGPKNKARRSSAYGIATAAVAVPMLPIHLASGLAAVLGCTLGCTLGDFRSNAPFPRREWGIFAGPAGINLPLTIPVDC